MCITKWNTLSFADIKHPDSSRSQLLYFLFQRARNLQSMLDAPCNSPLLMRCYIIRVVKNEPFYVPLITMSIPQDQNTFHTQLHRCTHRHEVENLWRAPSASSKVYHVEREDSENDEEFELHYTDSGAPFFKQRIMRGTSSFSTLNHRGKRSFYRGSYRRGRGPLPQGSNCVIFAPSRNPEDSTGHTVLCCFCNSWFHFLRDCPEYNKHSAN